MARARQEIEQLAELLDAGVDAGAAKGELASLLALASSVSEHVELPTPSPDFRAALRTELLTAPAPAAVPAPTSVGDRVRRFVEERAPELGNSGRFIGATAAGAALLASGGIVTAAQQALPGDLFYGIKGTTEDIRMAFSAGDAEQGRLHLAFADERLQEVENGLDRLTSDLLADTLGRLDDEVLLAADNLLAAFAATADLATVNELTTFTADASTRLTALSTRLPAEVVPLAENSLEVLRRVDVQAAIATGEAAATETCAACAPAAARATVVQENVVPRPGEAPAVPVTECDCLTPAASPKPASEPTPEPTTEPTPAEPEPTPEPSDEEPPVDAVPVLPGPLDPIGEEVDRQVDDLLDQLPVNPVEQAPDPVREPAEEILETANDTASEVSRTIDDILP